MKKIELTLLLGICLAILLTGFSSFSRVCENVRQDTLRLHILANSNSDIDQEAKLYVRDEILRVHGEMFGQSKTKAGAKLSAQSAAQQVKETAQKALSDKGLHYNVNIGIENMYFATTHYDDFVLPAGRYDALRVELGTAEGKNWFCVLFPPLCVPAALDDAANGYNDKEAKTVNSSYKIKFAVLEWLLAGKEKA